MKFSAYFLFFPVITLIISTSYAYPLDYLEEDFVRPDETEVEWFISGIIAEVPRTVAFSEADDSNKEETKPHLGYGFGMLFPHGLNNMLGDFLGDFIGPIGLRFAYLTGGPLSPEGDALDLNNPDKEPYESTIVELDFVYPYGIGGRGFSFILNSWEYISTTTQETKYRWKDLPIGTRMKQTIGMIGFEIPFTLLSHDRLGFGLPRTALGLLARYEILILQMTTLAPPIEEVIGSHILTFGGFFSCGITEWLYAEFAVQIGGGVYGPSSFVAHVDFKIEYTQKPPFFYGDHVELVLSMSADVTVTNFGELYLYDPNAENQDNKGSISWSRLDIRFGFRIWF